NAARTDAVHFYQIWRLPDRSGHAPRYDQRSFPEDERRGRLRLVASPDGRDGSLSIHQDAEVYLASLGPGDRVAHALRVGRYAWLQVLGGAVELNGVALAAGDGAAAGEEPSLAVTAAAPAEVMLFDLPSEGEHDRQCRRCEFVQVMTKTIEQGEPRHGRESSGHLLQHVRARLPAGGGG